MKNFFFKRWVLLFSHSGSEAAQLVSGLHEQGSTMLDIEVFTNNKDTMDWDKNWPVVKNELGEFDALSYRPATLVTSAINQALVEAARPTLVTCHGYDRIIPKEVLDNPNVEIYNMHPGDTISYPVLVGKDPQEKALELKLPHTGVMLHRVTEELDGGPLYGFIRYDMKSNETLTSLINNLKEESLNLWFPFLVSKLNQ